MGKLKYLMGIIFGLCLVLSLSNCKKCKGEDPRARIINNSSQKVSVQIQTSGGNTVNMNNVLSGSTSDYSSYAPGDVVFTVSVGNKTNVVSSVKMDQCFDYDIAIDENGAVTSTPTDRNK
jgi:hypothetical protein